MCQIVVINNGEKEIDTPRKFEQYFGFLPICIEDVQLDLCLCQCDIEETFKSRNIPFTTDFGDYYVNN